VRIQVDSDSCVGSGQCALALPEVFDQDDADGRVVLLDDRPPTELHGAVREAASRCPVRAITAQ
jgi:ferredoxin